MKTAAQLAASPKATEAGRRLKMAGITDAWWSGLLERVVRLPEKHKRILRETKTEAAERRRALADRMRAVAGQIDSDPEACDFYPGYSLRDVAGRIDFGDPHLRIGKPHENALALSEWLAKCADNLEEGSGSDAISRPLEDRRATGLRPFVIRGVFDWIEFYMERGRGLGIVTSTRVRNVEAALIASALLDEEVTPNNVTQVRRNYRTPYPYRLEQ